MGVIEKENTILLTNMELRAIYGLVKDQIIHGKYEVRSNMNFSLDLLFKLRTEMEYRNLI